MRLALVGGAPGIGKTSVARRLLEIAIAGRTLVQWVDVDALWLHQPWRVDTTDPAPVRCRDRRHDASSCFRDES